MRDDVIRMAKEAGINIEHPEEVDLVGYDDIERFAELVAARDKDDAERYRFAMDNNDFAVCKFDENRRGWVPIRGASVIDAARAKEQTP